MNDERAVEVIADQLKRDLSAAGVLAALRAEGFEIHTPEVCMDRALTALRSAFTTDKPPIRITSDDVPVGGDS